MSRRQDDPYAEPRGGRGVLVWLGRVFFLGLALTGCLTAGFVLVSRYRAGQQASPVVVEGGAAHLSPVERVYLQTYLSTRADSLQREAGRGQEPLPFVITPGESAPDIALNLAADNLIIDTELFLNYLRFYGLDNALEAGTYVVDPRWPLPELAAHLTDSVGPEITLRFLEGWRSEEMAAYLNATTPAQIDGDHFLALVKGQRPFSRADYDFLASLPAGATLEGYLFPDTYRIPLDANAEHLLGLMLANFGRRVTPSMRQSFGVQGLSLRDGVTLASIVEREAVVAVERPLMAGVFLNRLNQGIKLDADPTVQYAVGYQPASDNWWKSPLSLADLRLNSPFNTYLTPGLPPAPIANPGLASLEAVANPTPSDYIFFVADCLAADGTHRFSITYDEHVANVNRCR